MDNDKNLMNFSLGYNFDSSLIDEIIRLNSINVSHRRISEFFAAMPDSPYLSTRPDSRIKNISWDDFEVQVKKMHENSINFNYLFNAKNELKELNLTKFRHFLNKLEDIGIKQLIAYSPDLCKVIKKSNPNFEITISSVYGVKTKAQLDEVHKSGADYAYVDSIFINRNFKLLRELRKHAKVPLKLYANVSCLSQCPNKDLHYTVLSSSDRKYQIEMNDELFKYCSTKKLSNPTTWIQMQWIRPEDIEVYVEEGFNHFKLTDRLAPTESLILIAEHYLKGISPADLFPIMERNGTKYKDLMANTQVPFFVDNSKIPNDFIEHFRKGICNSSDIHCKYCNEIAKKTIFVRKKMQYL
jgi:collagenase-like PrtC family protease